jgi:hypothetical protein
MTKIAAVFGRRLDPSFTESLVAVDECVVVHDRLQQCCRLGEQVGVGILTGRSCLWSCCGGAEKTDAGVRWWSIAQVALGASVVVMVVPC